MSSSATRLAPDLTTSARLPSGVIATAEGVAGGAAWVPGVVLGLATDTVPTSFTLLPSIDSMLTESSARFATSASVPARLIAIPEGCLPASTVPIWTACPRGPNGSNRQRQTGRLNHRNNQWREAERGLERVGRRVKAPTLPLSRRARAPAREMAPEIKDRGRPTRSSGGRS